MTFKVALVCIAKNEDHYIEEWVRYHLKLGFDHVFIYENDWECPLDHRDVTKISWPGNTQQLAAYNNFIANNKNDYTWAAFLDVDEFLVLHKHSKIQKFLQEHHHRSAVGVNWFFFGDNNHTAPSATYSVLERFTSRSATVDQHVKTIANLNHVKMMPHPHFPSCEWFDTDGVVHNQTPFNPNGPTDQAQINHYFTKTRHEFEQKVARGRADTLQQRSVNEFDATNINEVEDLTALNFYRTP